MLSQRQRTLIRATFDHVRQHKERAGEMFYEGLFALNPELRGMFHRTPIAMQGGKLMQVIEYAVDHLEEWSPVTERLEQLGKRHLACGVRGDDYAAIGAALIVTLRKVLGAELSEETEEAWMELYTDLSLAMEGAGKLNPT
jgi:hemoglobin-like flavoprotein